MQQAPLSACARGRFREATYEAELCLKEQPLATYLDNVVLKGLQIVERDYERGALYEDNLKRISPTVKAMMDDLADFEPRRWFRKSGSC